MKSLSNATSRRLIFTLAVGLPVIALLATRSGPQPAASHSDPVPDQVDRIDRDDQRDRIRRSMHHLNARDSALQDELHSLRQEVKQLREATNQPEPDGKGSSSVGNDAVPRGQPGADRGAEEALAAQLSLLEDTIAAETLDQTWAASAVESLHQTFARDELTGVHLDRAECRNTFCRLEISFDTADHRDVGLHSAMHELPWQAEGFFHLAGDSLEALVYLAREGHSLPRVHSPR
ncbi:MAG: hypothetical protein MJE77_40530 [Proteobacteria bacterium]|nr:hypothetical protein [Pseudomonadota bacterium]